LKVGRNDPCPCGSGKKYKKCCLPLDREAGGASAPGDPAAGAVRRAAVESRDWEVDLVSLPGTVEGQPAARHAAVFVVARGLIIHSETLDRPSPEPEAMAEVLARGVLETATKIEHFPKRVLVREHVVAEAMATHLPPRMEQGGRLVEPPRVEAGRLLALDEVVYAMLQEQDVPGRVRVTGPETWEGWGLPGEVVNRLLRAAAELFRADPWRALGDEEALDAIAPSGSSWTVFVLGRKGQEVGVMLYSDRRDFEDQMLLSDDEGYQDLEGRILDLAFVPAGEALQTLRRELESTGWEHADALPTLLTFNTPGGGLRRVDAEDLAAIVEALPRFVAENEEAFGDVGTGEPRWRVDAWRDEESGVELSWVPGRQPQGTVVRKT